MAEPSSLLAAMSPRVPAAVAFAAVLAVGVATFGYTVDDAYIVARYADNVVAGDGWAMNPGEPSDGVTGPAWVLPMALAVALGLPPLVVAKVLGLLAAALAAALVTRAVRRRRGGRAGAWLTVAVMGVCASYGIWAVAGLSTGVAALLTTVAVLSSRDRHPRRAAWLVGASIAMLAWLRPELAALSFAVLVGLSLRDRRAGAVAFGIALCGAVALVGARLSAYGDPLPLSFHAKPGDVEEGLRYAAAGIGVCTGIVGLVPAVLGVRTGRRGDAIVGAALVAHLLAVVLAGGDWMPGFRLLAPVVPLYAFAVGTAVARAKGPRRRVLATVALAAAILPAIDLAVQIPRAREAGEARETVGAEVAEWLADHGRSVALVDVGFLGRRSGLHVVDLGGVTDREVALRPGGYLDKAIDPGWLEQRDPDLVVLHSAAELWDEGALDMLAGFPVERRLARSAWLRDRYQVARVVRYAPAYHYVILERARAVP